MYQQDKNTNPQPNIIANNATKILRTEGNGGGFIPEKLYLPNNDSAIGILY